MAYEVEIKAHAYPELKEVLDRYTGTEGHPVHKDDVYYAMEGDVSPRFRIRDEGDQLLITAKRNRREGGLEMNEELEFSHPVKDKETMHRMALMIGCHVFIEKHKEGFEWMYGDVHIELLNVRSLGWYLEMEIMSPTDDREANRERILALYTILEGVGLSSCDVESRSYQQMLRERLEGEKKQENL